MTFSEALEKLKAGLCVTRDDAYFYLYLDTNDNKIVCVTKETPRSIKPWSPVADTLLFDDWILYGGYGSVKETIEYIGIGAKGYKEESLAFYTESGKCLLSTSVSYLLDQIRFLQRFDNVDRAQFFINVKTGKLHLQKGILR